MGAFFVYILKSSLCLAVFYLFYRVTVKQGNISPLQPDSLTEYHTAFVHTTSGNNHNQSAYYGQYSCNNCRRLADNV